MRGTIRYQRELQKTCLIAAECRKELTESYFGKTVLSGGVKNLIKCGLRLVDGQREIWYDISSLQPLEQVFAVKELSYPVLEKLLLQILEIIREMEAYLLDSRQLCLEPAYLYWDMETETLRFLYDFTQEKTESGVRELAAFLLERVSHEEERAVKLAYFLYEGAQTENFSFRTIEAFLEKQREEGQREEAPKEKERGEEDWRMEAPEAEETKAKETKAKGRAKKERPQKEISLRPHVDLKYGKVGDVLETIDPRLLLRAGLICALLSLLTGLALGAASLCLILTGIEQGIWLSVSVALFAVGLGSFACGLVQEKRESGHEGKRRAVQETIRAKEERDRPEISEDPFWMQEWETKEEPKDESNGRTVYIGAALKERSYCLVELKKGMEKEYPVSAYPFLIGKDKEHVNLCVKDRSVSRLHARLLEEEGQIYVEDLHSTNGTYLNELLLEPHQKMRIRRGDALQLGRTEFIVR